MPFDNIPLKTVLEMSFDERLALARDIIASLPAETVNLEAWVWSPYEGYSSTWDPEHGCGTIACAMGHLTAHPLFKEAGLHFNLENRSPEIGFARGFGAVVTLFGPNAYCFGQRENDEPPLNDRELFLHRCAKII